MSAFPRQAWLAATRKALIAAPAEALGYSDPRGRPELRQALAGYLARARGVQVTPDRVVVCSGYTQGLALLCQVLRARGAKVLAVEAVGQETHRNAAVASGLAVDPLPVDSHGAVISQLGRAEAVLLTPAHQFPYGAALAPQRRHQVIDWATTTGGLILEDDYDGEFRYDRQPVGALQALAPEHVVYGGTASKSLAPGLRLGWLVVPAGLVDEIVAVKDLTDRSTSSVDQLTLAEFIRSGGYDRQVRRSRLAYRRRRDRLVAALQRHAPDVGITGITACRTCYSNCPQATPRPDSSPAPPPAAWPWKDSAATTPPRVPIRPPWLSATAPLPSTPSPAPLRASPPPSLIPADPPSGRASTVRPASRAGVTSHLPPSVVPALFRR